MMLGVCDQQASPLCNERDGFSLKSAVTAMDAGIVFLVERFSIDLVF
jgi:hypothetical protein